MMQVISTKSGATTKECPPTGKLIILTGPSGVGKGTLMRSLLQRHPQLHYSVSVTTRSPRPGETNGKDYYFVSRREFEELVAAGELLEWAEFAGNYYGTPREAVMNQIRSGKRVVLEIELKGARQIHTCYPSALSIFILPPSMSELEKRIRGRAQDSDEAIARRLRCAQEEINAADEFDIQIVNDDFESALNSIEAAILS
ncbi:MAG: guanylate kinase [Brasilonema octagenarum HA4186-MV1]|jgi:guanylate kinase|uniref:Guanylate kinase n=1 Tax=Brasilonema sennae CENA114 TaxID=415709 RepID=A0A856M9E9_9CYAN|nr:guanylate kinase [Brasilonema sennae]MBW4626824.1 guanylate kinase [Brasilonema octagenarum HA4186-MV1]QDL07815.1 guanylate kinase [Brasilonema sennae CENA114]QDL14175.1 guanylate kinase [Brasilonema octagenarum UFV-E1]